MKKTAVLSVADLLTSCLDLFDDCNKPNSMQKNIVFRKFLGVNLQPIWLGLDDRINTSKKYEVSKTRRDIVLIELYNLSAVFKPNLSQLWQSTHSIKMNSR